MHNRTCSSLFMPMKTPSVTIQGNITVMRYRNDVMRSVLLHIRANLGMMLARDYARSTLVMIVANNVYKLSWPAKSLDFNPIDHLLDLLKRKVCVQPLQLNLRDLTHVIHQMCVAIPQQYMYM